jgi:hypothetical protein
MEHQENITSTIRRNNVKYEQRINFQLVSKKESSINTIDKEITYKTQICL